MNKFSKFINICVMIVASSLLLNGIDLGQDNAIQIPLEKVKTDVGGLAKSLNRADTLDKKIIYSTLKEYLKNNPGIYGAAVALAPKEENGKTVKSAPYVYWSGDKLLEKDLIDSYDYTAENQKWYNDPVKLKKAMWSQPYFDKGGGEVWMMTYSIPVFTRGKNPKLVGVVTSNIKMPNNK